MQRLCIQLRIVFFDTFLHHRSMQLGMYIEKIVSMQLLNGLNLNRYNFRTIQYIGLAARGIHFIFVAYRHIFASTMLVFIHTINYQGILYIHGFSLTKPAFKILSCVLRLSNQM